MPAGRQELVHVGIHKQQDVAAGDGGSAVAAVAAPDGPATRPPERREHRPAAGNLRGPRLPRSGSRSSIDWRAAARLRLRWPMFLERDDDRSAASGFPAQDYSLPVRRRRIRRADTTSGRDTIAAQVDGRLGDPSLHSFGLMAVSSHVQSSPPLLPGDHVHSRSGSGRADRRVHARHVRASHVTCRADDVVGGFAHRPVQRIRFDIGAPFLHQDRIVRPSGTRSSATSSSGASLSRIHYNGRFFDYPLKPANALQGLGVINAVRILASYVKWTSGHPLKTTSSSWCHNRSGNGCTRSSSRL